MGNQKHVRPRVGAVPGYVEYDGLAPGVRDRRPFPALGGSACRRFFVTMAEAGRNPRLVNPIKEQNRGS